MEKAEEAEAHPSQKSLAWEFHLAMCSDSFFSPSLCWIPPPQLPTFFTACHLFRNTTLLSKWKEHIKTPFAFTPFLLAQAKKEKKKKSLTTNNAGQIYACVRITYVCMFATCRLATCWHVESLCSCKWQLKIRCSLEGRCLFKLTWWHL